MCLSIRKGSLVFLVFSYFFVVVVIVVVVNCIPRLCFGKADVEINFKYYNNKANNENVLANQKCFVFDIIIVCMR